MLGGRSPAFQATLQADLGFLFATYLWLTLSKEENQNLETKVTIQPKIFLPIL